MEIVQQHLADHQLRTLSEYAIARGTAEWTEEPIAVAMGIRLAMDNLLAELCQEGVTGKLALIRVAALLDVDFDTLVRDRRRGKLRVW
jgi:hypothetical protein